MINQAANTSHSLPRRAIARGTAHSSVQDPDGFWCWRYDPDRRSTDLDPGETERLWTTVASMPDETVLVRGGHGTFVSTAALDRFDRIAPKTTVVTVDGAGHSVHGDLPLQLAEIIATTIGVNS